MPSGAEILTADELMKAGLSRTRQARTGPQ
jgi:hypothetical protein